MEGGRRERERDRRSRGVRSRLGGFEIRVKVRLRAQDQLDYHAAMCTHRRHARADDARDDREDQPPEADDLETLVEAVQLMRPAFQHREGDVHGVGGGHDGADDLVGDEQYEGVSD